MRTELQKPLQANIFKQIAAAAEEAKEGQPGPHANGHGGVAEVAAVPADEAVDAPLGLLSVKDARAQDTL